MHLRGATLGGRLARAVAKPLGLCPLYLFPYSLYSVYPLLFLGFISFSLFQCASVGANTFVWVPHFSFAILNVTCRLRSAITEKFWKRSAVKLNPDTYFLASKHHISCSANWIILNNIARHFCKMFTYCISTIKLYSLACLNISTKKKNLLLIKIASFWGGFNSFAKYTSVE